EKRDGGWGAGVGPWHRVGREDRMNPIGGTLVGAAIALAAIPASAKPKHTPQHDAALRRCTDQYEAARAAAHAPNSPKGAARHRAMHAAAEAKKDCVARAPK